MAPRELPRHHSKPLSSLNTSQYFLMYRQRGEAPLCWKVNHSVIIQCDLIVVGSLDCPELSLGAGLFYSPILLSLVWVWIHHTWAESEEVYLFVFGKVITATGSCNSCILIFGTEVLLCKINILYDTCLSCQRAVHCLSYIATPKQLFHFTSVSRVSRWNSRR